MENFAKIFENHTGDRPKLAYRQETDEYEGPFLDCMCLLREMVCEKPPTRREVAQLFKRLFYNAN